MSFKPTSVPTKRLSASITSTQLTFKLDDITAWNGIALTAADFGTQAYGVFRNGRRDLIEIFEFDPATIASASITIVRRGLNFNGDRTTEVAGNKLEWTAGDTFVDLGTDTPQLWQYLEDYINDVAISGAPNASETVKGIVQQATLAQRKAGTDVGSTGASLFVKPTDVDIVANTIVPKPNTDVGLPVALSVVTNTTAQVGMVEINKKIVVNNITFRTTTVSVAGALKISMYSEDGQTQLFSVTSGTLASSLPYTISVPSVTVIPGNYYLVVQPVGSANIQTFAWTNTAPFMLTTGILEVAGKAKLSGTLTVTADTPPTTFDPTTLTPALNKIFVCRLDN